MNHSNNSQKEELTKPVYLRTWFISIMFTFSFLVVPFIIGLGLLFFHYQFEEKQKQDIKDHNNKEDNSSQIIADAEAYKKRIVAEADDLKEEANRELSCIKEEINRLNIEANALKEEIAKLTLEASAKSSNENTVKQSVTVNSPQPDPQGVPTQNNVETVTNSNSNQTEIEEDHKNTENDPAEFERLKKLCETIHKEYKSLLKEYGTLDVEYDSDRMVYILKECYRKLSVIETTISHHDCYDKIDIDNEQEKICKKARTFINKYIKSEKESGLEKQDISIYQFEDDLDFISDYIFDKEMYLDGC